MPRAGLPTARLPLRARRLRPPEGCGEGLRRPPLASPRSASASRPWRCLGAGSPYPAYPGPFALLGAYGCRGNSRGCGARAYALAHGRSSNSIGTGARACALAHSSCRGGSRLRLTSGLLPSSRPTVGLASCAPRYSSPHQSPKDSETPFPAKARPCPPALRWQPRTDHARGPKAR